MVFQALRRDSQIRLSETIDRAKLFLLGLEEVSPWRRPFDVSGSTSQTSNLPVDIDFGNFYSLLMKVLDRHKEIKYQNNGNPDDFGLHMGSLSPLGFDCTFSDFIQKGRQESRVSVVVRSAGQRAPLDYSLVTVTVPLFRPGQVNEIWATPDTVQRIFDYLLDFCDAEFCTIYSSHQNLKSSTFDGNNVNVGWYTYFQSEKVKSALFEEPNGRTYRGGLLLKLGKDVSVFDDPQVDDQIASIRRRLREAGKLNWRS
jgi:hypothetical protein